MILNIIVTVLILMLSIYLISSTNLMKNLLELKSYRKNNKNLFLMVKMSIITFLFIPPIISIFFKQMVLASILFLINICFAIYLHKILTAIEEELTLQIADYVNNFIKEFSIQTNLIDVIHSVLSANDNNNFMNELFSSIFDDFLRTQDKDVFGKELLIQENLWISSFLMILDEYTKSSDKEVAIKSLNSLYEMIDIKISATEEMKSKMNIMSFTNNLLLGIGVLGGAMNLIFNKYSNVFFFKSFKGNILFLFADVLIFISLITISKMINTSNIS